MCYNSVLIRSNANRLTYGNRPYMFVPCNKCFACRSARSDSYFIRTVNEMKSFNSNILALFVLLTYNENELPRISADDFCDITPDPVNIKTRLSKNSAFEFQDDGIIPASDFNEEECKYLPLSQIRVHPLPTFNVDHIDKFFKHLRSHLKKFYGFIPRISYFLVAENGDRFKRPHYHVILFIDIPRYIGGVDNVNILRNMISVCWSVRKFVDPYPCHRKDKDGHFLYYRDGRPKTYMRTTRMVSLGMTSLGKKGTPPVINMTDINKVSRYLAEYLVNDPYFEEVHKPNLDQLSPRNQQIYRKKFGTFRLTSQFFGISALDRITDNDVLNCQVRIDGVDHPYRMPLYYQRYVYDSKITYVHAYETRRTLDSDRGIYEVKPKYRSVISHNENWKLMKKHKFTEMYASLLSSFCDFRAWLLNDSSEKVHVAFYNEYLMNQPAFMDLLMRNRCSDVRWIRPTMKNMRLWIQLLSPRKLLGYYLLLFNNYSYDPSPDPFTTPKALFNLNYTHERLDDEEFVRSCYEDHIDKSSISHFLDRQVDSRSRELQMWMYKFEYLCICFQSYQHFALFRVDQNKIADWNIKAKEIGKSKFIIQPHE